MPPGEPPWGLVLMLSVLDTGLLTVLAAKTTPELAGDWINIGIMTLFFTGVLYALSLRHERRGHT